VAKFDIVGPYFSRQLTMTKFVTLITPGFEKEGNFFPFRKFADEPKCKCLCVFAKCGSRVKPCVCCVQSSDPRFSNACGEPMAPPTLQLKGLGSKLKAHMLLAREIT
jgi:hypothetical protein